MPDVVLTDPGEVYRTLPGLLARDPFAFWSVDPAGARVLAAGPHAFVTRVPTWGMDAVVARGDLGQVLALLQSHTGEFTDVEAAFVPFGLEQSYPGALRDLLGLVPQRPWVWMSAATAPPPRPGEDRCGFLEDCRDEIAALLPEANPETHLTADADVLWWGYRDEDGRLLSVCAVEPPGDGRRGVQLGGFGTHPAARGRGVGTAMMASMTRWGVKEHGFVHYGVWSDNERAVSLYQRLGFTIGAEIQWYSRQGTGSVAS